MILADGARFDISGMVTSRLGRVRLDLSWPREFNEDAAPPYEEFITGFAAPPGMRGLAPFYDQRVNMRPPDILQDPEFELGTAEWAVTGDFAYVAGNQSFDYTHSGGSGTLTQLTTDFEPDKDGVARVPKPNTTYVLTYSVQVDNPGNITQFEVNASFNGTARALTIADGEHTLELQTGAATIGNFVIDVASNPSVILQIFKMELREKENTSFEPPQRLNLVYKAESKIFLNANFGEDGTDILDGVGVIIGNKRAKIIPYGDEVFIADPENKPLVMRRRPRNEQEYRERAIYDIRNCGINWPKSNTEQHTVSLSGVGTAPPNRIYRFRVTLEDKWGDESNASLPTAHTAINTSPPVVRIPRLSGDVLNGPNAVTHWRIYVSYEQAEFFEGGSTVDLQGDGPTAFVFAQRLPIDTATFEYNNDVHEFRNQASLLPFERGAPPKLLDMVIINDVGYGIAASDSLPREKLILEGPGRPLNFTARQQVPTTGEPLGFSRPAFDNTEIEFMRVNSQFLFISAPSEPQYMEQWIRFGRGEEVGIGLAELGQKPVIFTNLGIYIYDPVEISLSRIVSEVGALSRDSIQATEQGIRFIGSDGVPRLFNGATVDEISTEVLPIFDKEDYTGDYKKFSRPLVGNVVTTNGDRRFYMVYPVSETAGQVPAIAADVIPGQPSNLLVGDLTQGRMKWAIDKTSYEEIRWFGREGRLAAVDDKGFFYYIEEGFVDITPNTTPDPAPQFDWKFRWFAGRDRRLTRFTKINVEMDTKGKNVTMICSVDEHPAMNHAFTINHDGRQQFQSPLPAHFKGLFLEVRFQGQTDATDGRPEIYDLQVETIPMGVF
jgi:hypothetical protein